VVKALEAVRASGVACDVIDVPLLSRCPAALPQLLQSHSYSGLLLVDVCREGGGPLPHLASHLHNEQLMPPTWRLLTAAPTYNPLGRTLTFISTEGIQDALAQLAQEAHVPPGRASSTLSQAASVLTGGPASASTRALVVCPGRGSYNATELGSLARLPDPSSWQPLMAQADAACTAAGLRAITDLDGAATFSRDEHLEPAHSSVLTYSIAAADYAARFGSGGSSAADGITPVGICGNSLGWYTAVHCSGALSFGAGLDIILTSGAHQRETPQVGGQLVYPALGEEWDESADLGATVDAALQRANAVGFASLSIELGGMAVLAADDAGMHELLSALPTMRRGRVKYPLVLPKHSAFHTPLMSDLADALERSVPPLTTPPALPLADGAGRVWPVGEACDLAALREYTLREQVVTPYRFGRSIEAAIEATDPDVLLLLGPGASLGGAVGQALSRMRWRGISNKATFQAVQASATPALMVVG
jgi:[acyl-carrier-protein] S-malonyltransferase